MISPELDLRDLDARHWTNWWHLLVPPRVLAQPRWALVVLDGQTPIKVIIAGAGARGAIEPPALPPITRSLEAWATLLDVAAVIAIERGVIAELSAEIEAQLSLAQDYAEQGLIVLRALKRRANHGVWSEPPLLDLLPTPSYEAIQRTFDLLVPDRSALVAYVIDDDRGRIHSSIIAVKQDGDITRAATHRAIADLVPEVGFARDWGKGYKRVLAAVEERFAKPSVAVFLERATVLRIVTGPGDQLPRELNSRNVVID
ncbi:MAG: hypothetical protein H0T79_22270, partial [Deltaproteobacteria bacterium]|nr:hypothetical protein [Deltaproteobacteria bacterium]